MVFSGTDQLKEVTSPGSIDMAKNDSIQQNIITGKTREDLDKKPEKY